jgi:F0F1-type ATP synthase epsilon subunit
MILKIVTPTKDEVQYRAIEHVNLHLSNGYPISIYPGHAKLIALIAQGKVHIYKKQSSEQIQISEGVMVVNQDTINCFIDWTTPSTKLENEQ